MGRLAVALGCLGVVLAACIPLSPPAPPDVAATAGAPFALRIGQSARIAAPAVRVTLEAVAPAGECPPRTTCTAVSPPSVQVSLARDGSAPERLVLLLPGPESKEARFEGGSIRVVSVAPFPITKEDAAGGRHTVTLVVQP
jgi:hypothetical protein